MRTNLRAGNILRCNFGFTALLQVLLLIQVPVLGQQKLYNPVVFRWSSLNKIDTHNIDIESKTDVVEMLFVVGWLWC